MKFMLIIMSAASHSHMGNFIWKFHLPAEISPCSIPYQYDVEKRRREKNNPDIFPEEGMREKEQRSAYQKDGSANQGFSYGYSFWSLFMGGKKKKNQWSTSYCCSLHVGQGGQLYEHA